MKTIIQWTVIILWIASCQSLKIASFDSFSLHKTNELKRKTNHLLSTSSDDFIKHQTEINSLIQDLDFQYVYEKGRLNNSITVSMWEKLVHNKQSLIVSYVNLWKKQGRMNPKFTSEATLQINEAFDKIIDLETKKTH